MKKPIAITMATDTSASRQSIANRMISTTTIENACPTRRVAPAWIIASSALTSDTTRETRLPERSRVKRDSGSASSRP